MLFELSSDSKDLGSGGLGDVVSALAHDLRTPLACLKGYLTLLDEGKYPPGSPEWTEFFSLCVGECDHIETLIESLLESTVETPEIVLHREVVPVQPLINHVVNELSAIQPDRRFVVDVHPKSRTVWCDPLRLQQVIRNLLDNAVKYSDPDTLVVVRVRRRDDETLFSVSDQGYGIAPEHLNRLFERFYRIRDVRSSGVKGTGLGLPIARMVVEAHSGEIWAESALGKGSTFNFTVPHGEDDLLPGDVSSHKGSPGGDPA